MTIDYTLYNDDKKNLIKFLRENFYADLLPYSEEIVKHLISSLLESNFNLKSFFEIDDKETNDYLANFLPPVKDLDFNNPALRDELLDEYLDGKKNGKFQKGLPQFFIEKLYDSRFVKEINNKVGVSQTLIKNHFSGTQKNSIVEDYLKLTKDCWGFDFDFDNSEKNKPLFVKWSDFSKITSNKFIGKKEKRSNPEALNNIYSVYKIYGQNLYSKIINASSSQILDPSESLVEISKVGFNEIINRLNQYHKNKNQSSDNLNGNKKFLKSEIEDLIIVNFFNPKDSITKNKSKSDYYYDHPIYSLITAEQIVCINESLQRFTGDYIPLFIDDVYINSNGTKKTLLEHLYNQCLHVIFKVKNNKLDFEKYETGLPFEKNEAQKINSLYDKVKSYRESLTKDDKIIFDKYIYTQDGLTFSRDNGIDFFDKLSLLKSAYYFSCSRDEYNSLKSIFKGNLWKDIMTKKEIDNSQSLDVKQQKPKIVNPDEIIIRGTMGDDGRITGNESIFNDELNSIHIFDKVDSDDGQEIDDDDNEMSQDFTDDTNQDLDCISNNSPAEYLLSLIENEFERNSFMYEIFKKMIQMQLYNKIDPSLSTKKNMVSNPELNSAQALFYLFDLCDQVHSYDSLWRNYIGSGSMDEEEDKKVFVGKMKRIRAAYKKNIMMKGDF